MTGKKVIHARIDEGELARAKANRNADTDSELIRLLIHDAARAPPKRTASNNPISQSRSKQTELPNEAIEDMKLLILDRQRLGHNIDRETIRRILRKEYPIESSMAEDAILDAALSIV